MSTLDWLVLLLTLSGILCYGVYKGRNQRDVNSYLLAGKSLPWYLVLLGIMATQASSITFISAPGQAYTDGMRFVQYYFGLPLAMIVICITFIPVYQKLNVYTAYEFLGTRFNKETRYFTAFLFLTSRAFSTGISIYAPSIILSTILGWNIYLTTVAMGGLLIVYTCFGGAKAVAHTQKLQFLIIVGAIAFAGYYIVKGLPEGLGFMDAITISGKAGKLNIITTDFDWKDKYNIWSGLIGGFFLALSYFGTDQSQVGRYISANNLRNARLGLLMNGLVKIPMQFLILLVGVLLFAFYSTQYAPLSFNNSALETLRKVWPERVTDMERKHARLQERQQYLSLRLTKENRLAKTDPATEAEYQENKLKIEGLREDLNTMIKESNISTDTSDVNYIFLYYIKENLPKGLVGLLFAVIFLASWGSVSAALNSMAASSMLDFRGARLSRDEAGELWQGRLHTFIWGAFSVAMAMLASRMGSLIEAVNILGSLFYGTILGIFLVAFYIRRVNGRAVLIAAVLTEAIILLIYYSDIISFLWLNVAGAVLVPFFGFCFSFAGSRPQLNRQ